MYKWYNWYFGSFFCIVFLSSSTTSFFRNVLHPGLAIFCKKVFLPRPMSRPRSSRIEDSLCCKGGTGVTFAPKRGSHSPLNQKGSHSPLNNNNLNMLLNPLGFNLGTRGLLGDWGLGGDMGAYVDLSLYSICYSTL